MANFGRPGMGRNSFGGFLYNTPIIRTILFVNVGVFLFEMFFGNLRFSGVPIMSYIDKYFYLWPLGSGNFYPWQLVSYMFLHEPGSLMHIGFNMLALWMFGTQIELVWGPKKFLTYYFLCGLGGAAAHLFISPLLGGGVAPLIGASGAIFGLLVAYGLLFPDQLVFVFFLLPMKAKYAVGLFVVLELMSVGAADNIGHLAHLGGAVVGLIYMIATTGSNLFSAFTLRKQNDRNDSWKQRSSGGSIFHRRQDDDDLVDAEYHDIGGTMTKTRGNIGTRVITQEDIDRILDKIAASGYQNLSEEEREILIEASRKMEQKG
jgi:membrane associated rhomboid family serine protease